MRPAAVLANALRDAQWANPTRLRNYALLLALANLVGLAVLASYAPAGFDPRGEPVGSDFVSFWTAGRMTLAHHAAEVYSPDAHLAAERAGLGRPIGWYAFFYPPIFLLVCWPLGLLSYFGALAVWLGATLAAFVAAVRALAPRFAHPLTLAAYPAMLTNIGHGQNAFLSAALYAGAAGFLDRRPALAGVLIGALSFKPQLALVAPLALLVAGRWRALAACAVTAAALFALSLIAFGPETWAAFLAETPLAQATLERGLVSPGKMQSLFAAVRVLGGPLALAYGAQALGAAVALGALVFAMRRERDGRRQIALAAVAACLTTPFLLDYDLTLLIVPIAVLAEDGLATGFRPFEKSALIAAFALPAFARPLAEVAHLPLSPLVVAALGLALIRRTWAGAPATARICREAAVAA